MKDDIVAVADGDGLALLSMKDDIVAVADGDGLALLSMKDDIVAVADGDIAEDVSLMTSTIINSALGSLGSSTTLLVFKDIAMTKNV